MASCPFCQKEECACSELKRRMELDPDLAEIILTRVFVERGEKSVFSRMLRDALLHHCAELHAKDSAEAGEEEWYDAHRDGIRGFYAYSDADLLGEYLNLLDDPSGNEWAGSQVLPPELWSEFESLPLRGECIERLAQESAILD